MNKYHSYDLTGLEFAEPMTHHGLTVFPVLGETTGPDYLTLNEAMNEQLLTVSEHGEGARVPELEVSNRSEKAVLILDGEILVGAKQNRTLNTTVLLAPKSQTVVPVSCVEAGRWSQHTPDFADLDAVVPHRVRHAKTFSVADSLAEGRGFVSDQGRVWSRIEDQLVQHRVNSPSSSMGQFYEDKERQLESYLEALPCGEHQRGMVVALGGTVVVADILSRPAAYAQVHRRLLKGYAAEDLEGPAGVPPVLEAENAREFLKGMTVGKPRRNPGVGLGEEWRYAGECGQGTVLVHEGSAVHAVFLGGEQPGSNPAADEPPILRRRRIME